MSKYKDIKKQFYMSFFSNEEGYEEKKINGFWLIKHWDGNNESWFVSLFSEESYRNYKRGQDLFTESQEKLSFIKNIE